MSERNEKLKRHSVKVPVYKLEVCLEEIDRIASHYNFDKNFLTATIIGDWLTHHALARKNAVDGSDEPLLSFLATCEKHFNEYVEYLRNVSNG